MAVLSNLQPEKVFYYFEKLCSVPHGSGNTKQISDLCVGFAKELGLKYRQEACNNVIIWKNGSCGYENAAPIILQGHIDMVCAKTEDCTKDMTRDGLDVRTDGEWVWADKTSARRRQRHRRCDDPRDFIRRNAPPSPHRGGLHRRRGGRYGRRVRAGLLGLEGQKAFEPRL